MKNKRRESRKRAHKRLKGRCIEERPSVVQERSEIGRWEADTVVGRHAGMVSIVLPLFEKSIGHDIALRIPGRTSEAVMAAISSIRSDYGDALECLIGAEFGQNDLEEIIEFWSNLELVENLRAKSFSDYCQTVVLKNNLSLIDLFKMPIGTIFIAHSSCSPAPPPPSRPPS